MKNKISKTIAISILVLTLIGALGYAATSPVRANTTGTTIWTDKADYSPEQIVTIYGTGFLSNAAITVSVTRPDSTVNTWVPSSDALGSFTTTYMLDGIQGTYQVYATDGVNWATTTFTDSQAKLEQCRNGGVGNTPVSCNPATGGSLGWVSGNAGKSDSHWREGDSIAYRVSVEKLTAGTHTLDIHYDVVHGSKHAIDYLTSYDRTETTGGPTAFHANNINPCSDFLSGADCDPTTPRDTLFITAPTFANCGGSTGTFPTPVADRYFKIWGASGTTLNSMTYLSQNVDQGSGVCQTFIEIAFTSVGSNGIVVITWGGHIAAESEWGAGNSATSISGSPYHMSLDLLDGASTGSQDRSLSASAIFFSPTITTTIKNASNANVTTVPVGTTVHDTATLSGASSNAGGTVTYQRFNNGACSGTPASTQTVTVTNAIIPDSSPFTPTSAGSYSYNALYSGDGPSGPNLPATSACEPLTVTTLSPTITTTVVPGTSISLGTAVHDTATLSGGFSPITGTVTYHFYTTFDCTGTPTDQTVTIGAGNSVPDSSPQTLGAGSYSYKAHYSGDANNNPADSSCEPFTVTKANTSISTSVIDDATGNTVPLSGSVPLGTTVHDTATVGTQVNGFVIGGTVTYYFYTNGGCSGGSTETVTMSGGTVPNSASHGPLAAGSYSFKAVYSGDSNYIGSTSGCEPFTVNKANTTITTTLVPNQSTFALGSSVADSATVVTQVNGFVIGGTVTYHFYTTGDCSGASSDQTVAMAGGLVPNSGSHGPLAAGSYSFKADYSGDSNYNGDSSACEPFSATRADTNTSTVVIDESTGLPVISPAALGTSVHDTATVGTQVNGFVIGGSVTYYFYTNGACSGTVAGEAVTMAGGLVPSSSSHGPLATGAYSFKAVYSGDANYNGSPSDCEPFTVGTGNTVIETTVIREDTGGVVNPIDSLPLGTTVHDTATVSPQVNGFVIGGTVTYHFYTTGDCSGASSDQTVAMAGGLVPNSGSHGPLAAGSYSFKADYSGDSNYNPSTSACEPFSVSKADTTITTTLVGATLGGNVPLGSLVGDSASVGGQVNGFSLNGGATVTFHFYSSGDCTGSFATFVEPENAAVAPSQGPLAAGDYSWNAQYNGNANYNASPVSTCEPFHVNKAQATVSTTVKREDTGATVPNGGIIPLGTTVHDTATVGTQVNGFVISGTVTYHFYTNGNCDGGSSDQLVAMAGGLVPNSGSHGPLAAGSYSFKADYSGDSNYNGDSSACEPFSVSKAGTSTSTALFTSAGVSIPLGGSVALGTSVYDTATVTAIPQPFTITGSVTYYFYTTIDCSGIPSSTDTVPVGSPSPTQGPLSAGSYSYNAVYNGDNNYNASPISGCEPFTVNKADTTTTTQVHNPSHTDITGSSVPLGTAVHDSATVSGAVSPFPITGMVTYSFYTNGNCNNGGPASTEIVAVGSESTPQTLGAGSYSYKASYSGDGNYNGSTSSCEPFSVNKADTTTNTSLFTSGGTPIPLGGSVPLGTSVFDLATTGPAVPPFPITGTVTYSFFNNVACPGTASFTETDPVNSPSSAQVSLAAGFYSFQATYNGDSNYNPSTSTCEPFTVLKADTATNTQVHDATHADITGTSQPLGTEVHDSASVGPAVPPFPITGSVTYSFYKNGDCFGTPFSTETVGVGVESTPQTLGAGSYSYKASYTGDSNYNPSTSGCEPFTITKAPTTIVTAVHDPSHNDVTFTNQPLGTSAHDSATVGTQVNGFLITGTVTYHFYTTGDCSGSPVDQTVAVGSESSAQTLGAGSYSYSATYNGNSNYFGSTSSCEPFTIAKAPTTIITHVHDPSHNDVTGQFVSTSTPVHDSATVGPAVPPFPIGGTVTYSFFNNGNCAGTPVSTETVGVGSESTPQTLAMGTYSYRASYSGDSNYNGSTSVCEPFTMTPTGAVTMTPVAFGNNIAMCTFDTNSTQSGQQFKLIFTQNSSLIYGLTASNPGQFVYNLFQFSGTSVGVTASIPYPFVTQGAVPVHIYDSVTVVSIGGAQCFVPGNDVTSLYTITPSPNGIITLGSYGGTFGSFALITVSGPMPATGQAYIWIHLDYGLKKTTGYTKAPNLDAVGATLTIANNGLYTFSSSGTVTDTQTIQNNNVFKRDPGVAGLVTDSSGTPIAGVKVTIKDSRGSVLATLTTDSDGYYQWTYKYTGKPSTFTATVTIGTKTYSQSFTIKSNAFVWVSFTIS